MKMKSNNETRLLEAVQKAQEQAKETKLNIYVYKTGSGYQTIIDFDGVDVERVRLYHRDWKFVARVDTDLLVNVAY